jgi:DNA-binding NarL/FixJ family response regulator
VTDDQGRELRKIVRIMHPTLDEEAHADISHRAAVRIIRAENSGVRHDPLKGAFGTWAGLFIKRAYADRRAYLSRMGRSDVHLSFVDIAPNIRRPPPEPPRTRNRPGENREELTERETEVLRAFLIYDTQPAVAKALRLSVKTVNTHVSTIYRVLSVCSVKGMILEALRRRIISPSDVGLTLSLFFSPKA